MILDALVAVLRERHPDRGMRLERGRVRRDDAEDIVFPAAHRDVGDLIIADDGDEATVFVGEITHAHFGCYEDGLTPVQKAEWIARDVAEFVTALFADRVLLWKGFGAGGSKIVERPATEPPRQYAGLEEMVRVVAALGAPDRWMTAT